MRWALWRPSLTNQYARRRNPDSIILHLYFVDQICIHKIIMLQLQICILSRVLTNSSKFVLIAKPGFYDDIVSKGLIFNSKTVLMGLAIKCDKIQKLRIFTVPFLQAQKQDFHGTHLKFFAFFSASRPKTPSWASREESDAPVRCATVAESSGGPIWATKRPIWARPSRPTPSEGPPTPRESFSRKCKLMNYLLLIYYRLKI